MPEKSYQDIAPSVRSIVNWQAMFVDIYGRRNRFRASWSRLVNSVAETLGILAESIRKDDFDAPRQLAGLGVRIFLLASWFDWDLATLVARRYHGRCPYVFTIGSNCGCPEAAGKKQFVEAVDPALLAQSLDSWQQFFDGLYWQNNREDGRDTVYMHLSEELGELIRALRYLDDESALEEIADLFAWWVGYAHVIEPTHLVDLLHETYPNTCATYGQNPCAVGGSCLSF